MGNIEMSGCQKCNVQLGLMIEDEQGKFCLACHPTAFGTGLSPQQILPKLENVDFKNVRERIYS
jgi:hypothetical protein